MSEAQCSYWVFHSSQAKAALQDHFEQLVRMGDTESEASAKCATIRDWLRSDTVIVHGMIFCREEYIEWCDRRQAETTDASQYIQAD